MGFPILRLPVVALKVLVDQFNDVELVIVSSLSKRADWFLKACGKKKVSFFNLSASEIKRLRNSVINFTVPIYFEYLKDIASFGRIRRNLKIGDSFFPAVVIRQADGVEEIHIFSNINTYGMIVFMEYFKNNFNLSIEQLNFATNRSRAIRTIVTHINSTQTVVKNVLIGCSPPISEDDFKFVLENVSATDYFVSGLTLSQNFKFHGTIRSKIIDVMNARWFTIQNVLESVESQEIHVYGNYTKDELRTFLEEWKAGKLPKLKELTLGTKLINLSIEQLQLAGNDSRALRTVIGHLNLTQTLVKNVLVEYNSPLSQDDFGFVLANISASESFSTRLDLRIFKYYGRIRAKNVNIENGHWFTLANLLRCTENEEIYVRGSNFRRLEFRTFLEKWKRGEFPKLKKVNVATQSRYLDVTGGFKKRRDKCVDTWGNGWKQLKDPVILMVLCTMLKDIFAWKYIMTKLMITSDKEFL